MTFQYTFRQVIGKRKGRRKGVVTMFVTVRHLTPNGFPIQASPTINASLLAFIDLEPNLLLL
jgi:hypothetical protein